jgi:GNAT superfamily N-acetyltransferase
MTNDAPQIAFRRLQGKEGEAFAMMTFPAYRHMMELQPTIRMPREHDDEPFEPLAVGAIREGRPAGLALGGIAPGTDEVELLSLFVAKEHRLTGIGRSLVRAFEEHARRLGRPRLTAVYMTGRPGSDVFEAIGRSLGWSAPETRMVSVRFSVESLSAAAWIHKYRFGRDWEVFPWDELPAEEYERIRRSNEAEAWIKPDLVPWKFDRLGFEPRTSLGARYKGEVVGWVINHQIEADTIRYTCSFMRQPWGRMGKILPLYSESFRRFAESGCPNATFTTPLHHRGMVAFARRWFAPWSTYFGESRGIEKSLT